MKLKGKSIFISRKLNLDSPLVTLTKKEEDCKIIDQSLIQITQIRYSYTPQTNWIIFYK